MRKATLILGWLCLIGAVEGPGLIASPPDKFGSHVIQIDHVYDGDTFYFRMPGAWSEISMVGVRVLGIDAPEKRGRCPAERALAKEATIMAQRFLSRGPVTLQHVRWDKYGGRIEADVLVDGQSLSEYMIDQKMARPYMGGHRDKMEWCR